MGADRSRRRTRSVQTVAGLMALGALMAGAAGATTQTAATARNHGLITGEVEPPKTVHQCEGKFGAKNAHERYVRAKCIERVEHELATAPGTSCKHPLEFNRGLEGGNGSPRYLSLKLSEKINAQGTGATMTWTWEVKSSKVEICPKGVTFEVTPSLPNGNEDIGHPSLVKHPPTTTRKGSFSYAMANGDSSGAAIKVRARFVK